MSLQILTLTLDGITAGDYLTWCRDPDPPALDFGLRSISIDADPLGDTITAILDWEQPAPTAATAATAAGLHALGRRPGRPPQAEPLRCCRSRSRREIALNGSRIAAAAPTPER